ncbi:MAG: hypothetical protein U0703_02815 [Anaerolineae bacterium]
MNSGALTAALPASIPVGSYTIEIADPTYGTATAPGSLTVVAAPVATPRRQRDADADRDRSPRTAAPDGQHLQRQSVEHLSRRHDDVHD